MNKPLLIFDGDCGFCRVWIDRWKRLSGDRIDYAPSQEVGKNYPDIPAEAFQKAVQLVEPDGRRSAAAEAVFRTLTYGGFCVGLWAYQKIPGFAAVSEYIYGVVAGHRPTFSMITRWIWGGSARGSCGFGEPSSYRQVRWIFLRALALIYAVAFGSFGWQLRGLIGSQGILPAGDLLNRLTGYGIVRFWYVPTLAWLNSSDAFLVGMCVAGVLFSTLLLFNIAPRVSLFALWLLYLSIVSVGGDFMNFQWDALLLETGFLAIFLAPSGLLPQIHGSRSPAPALVFLLRWLLFRLMFQSALVKWLSHPLYNSIVGTVPTIENFNRGTGLSGDLLWHHFTALTVHYQTQPLPNPLSWYVHHFPVWFHKLSCLLLFVIEGLVPFLIFTPRRFRLFAFWSLVGFQTLILLTGNYAFFNALALALCLLLLDDSTLRSWTAAWCDEPIREAQKKPHLGMTTAAILYLTTIPFLRIFGIQAPNWLMAPVVWASPLRSFRNSYGLFAVMTPSRPEIIIEGSNDGKTWLAYEFKYKPGDLARRPRQIAPFQPRLDWQMWFAALGVYRENPWFLNFCARLLQGSKPVTELLAKNPFPDNPPNALRATLYDYRFTTPEEHRQSGQWWVRKDLGLYCPILSFKKTL